MCGLPPRNMFKATPTGRALSSQFRLLVGQACRQLGPLSKTKLHRSDGLIPAKSVSLLQLGNAKGPSPRALIAEAWALAKAKRKLRVVLRWMKLNKDVRTFPGLFWGFGICGQSFGAKRPSCQESLRTSLKVLESFIGFGEGTYPKFFFRTEVEAVIIIL